MKRLLLFLILLILFSAEILRVYFVMPFPGSQIKNTIRYAHWISNNIIWIRLFSLAIITYILVIIFRTGKLWQKIFLSLIIATYAVVFYLFNFRYDADEIFKQPSNKSFAAAINAIDKTKLIIGVVINGDAKAYPIQLIGYHHQVKDTIGNIPVMITYCTVCRTGRAFSPIINGKEETFRLVGMDHFNAMFEDATTKSWWQQATGVAVTGPLKGMALKEFPSVQLTLDVWLRQHPNSTVMQPDAAYMNNYFKLEDYDKGTMQSNLVRRDVVSWKPKSWIVGVMYNLSSKAYDWNDLVNKKIIQDSIDKLPILLTIENDSSSFHVYDRRVNGEILLFKIADNHLLKDTNTNSTWNMDGICVEGELKDRKLIPVQAYNEFWHSWKTFHINAEKYVAN
jgi:hypothetical protein